MLKDLRSRDVFADKGLLERSAVLIVDGEAGKLKDLNTLLAKDYDVFFVDTAAEALSITTERAFHLIITNVLSTDPSDDSLCQLIKECPRTREIPILFLIEFDSNIDELLALENGGSDFAYHDVNPAILQLRIRNLISIRRKELLLKRHAFYDDLTSLPNNQYFLTKSDEEWRSSRREKLPFTAFVVEIDCFKDYTDHYGSVQSDACRKKVADILKFSLKRPRDFIARTEDDEFVGILPGTDYDGAATACERIRQSIEDAMIPHNSSSIGKTLTVSIGFECDPTSSKYRTYDEVLNKAEECLHYSKSFGCNRASYVQVDIAL